MHTVIIGGGPLVTCIAQRLLDDHQSVAVVEEDAHRAEELAIAFPDALIVHGKGTDSHSLSHAHTRDADIVIAAADTDTTNIVACLLAKRLFGVPAQLALSVCLDSALAYDALGIDYVCMPETVAIAVLDRVTSRSGG